MQEWFIEQLPTIERAIAFVCRRYKLTPTESEDFASSVKLKLIENDYAILRKFEHRSTFSSFIAVTVRRMLINQWVQERGRWNASAEAKRMGDAAVRLEVLLHREGRTLDEVIPIVATAFDLDNSRVEEMARRLPPRRPRPRDVDVEQIDYEKGLPGDVVESAAFEDERKKVATRAREIIRGALANVSEDDRVILRLRFFGGMSVADIARSLHLEQKLLYRRIERHLHAIRDALDEAGIRGDELDSVIAHMPDDFADAVRNAPLDSSIQMAVKDQGANS